MNHKDHNLDKVTFGFWVYLMSDCVLFAGLFATYAVLHTATFGALSAGDIVDVPYVLLETLLLLTSSFTMGLAWLLSRKGKTAAVMIALVATLVLGLGFLAMEANEFMHLIAEGAGPDRSAFLSSFFTLLGVHGAHVAAGAVWMLVLMAHILIKGFTAGTTRKLASLALFWHFLDIVWIFIFTFVYLFALI